MLANILLLYSFAKKTLYTSRKISLNSRNLFKKEELENLRLEQSK